MTFRQTTKSREETDYLPPKGKRYNRYSGSVGHG